MARIAVTNFSRGEFGPDLYGRIDVPQYGAGAKELTNFIVQRYGGVAFRPGFRFVGEVDDPDRQHRYLPFIFSIDQAYIVALDDEQQRELANGGFVVEDNLKILGVVTGATTTFNIPYHDYAVGDRLYIDGQVGMEELNGQFCRVTAVPDANHVTVDIDSSAYSAWTSSDGITRVGTPPAPPAPEPPPPAPPAPPTPPATTNPEPSPGTGTYEPRIPREWVNDTR